MRVDFGVVMLDANGAPVGPSGGAATDVSDRAARLLGVVANFPATAAAADAAAGATSTTFVKGLSYLYNGTTWDRQRTPFVFKALSAVSIAAEATIWTPGAGKRFRLMGATLASNVAGDVTFRDATAGTIIAVLTMQAGVAISFSPAWGNGILSAVANNVLSATGQATGTLSGTIFGTEE